MKLFICTPLHDNRIDYRCMVGYMQTLSKYGPNEVGAGARSGSFLPHLRDILTADFLNSKADYMLCVDSDVAWTVKHLDTLLSHEREFVSGLYARKQPKTGNEERDYAVAWDGDENSARGPLRKALSVGAGFMLMRRDAVEEMTKAYPDLAYPGDGIDMKNGAIVGLWSPVSITGKKCSSEDASFCYRWRVLNKTIWVDTRVKLGHVGDYVYT